MVEASASLMKQHWLIGSACAFACLNFFPVKTVHIDARGTAAQAVTIRLPRLSPAIAALEDSSRNWTEANAAIKTPKMPGVRLTAGMNSSALVAQLKPVPLFVQPQWLTDVKLGGRLQAKPQVTAAAPIQLRGLVIRSQEMPVAAPVQLAKVESSPMEVTPAERDHIVRELAATDWRTQTFEERAQALIKREAQKMAEQQSRPIITTGGVLVARADEPMLMAPSPSPTPEAPRAEQPHEPSSTVQWWSDRDAKAMGHVTLSGTVVLSGGLAMADAQDRLMVYREVDGVNAEQGQVWPHEGRFEIVTGGLKGRLLAQLRNGRGRILGQGEIRLGPLSQPSTGDRIENLKVVIAPKVLGAQLEVVSAYTYGESVQTVPDAQVWLDGAQFPLKTDREHRWFREEGLQAQSSFVARVAAENHWGTILIGLTGEEQRVALFPNKLINAFMNLTLGQDRTLAEHSGIVWGQITRHGQPLAGARVEMAGDHRLSPVYFNSLLLPDRFAEATSENGHFAFVWVTPGIQSVRVIYQGRAYPAQVIPVEQAHVSHLQFEVGDIDTLPLTMTDPMEPSREIQAVLRMAGDETNELDVQGQGRISLPVGPGILMMDGDAGENYELMRYSVPRAADFLSLPVVRRDWLLGLISRRKINVDSGSGMVVGFNMPDNFVARVENAGESQPEIVYFDSHGQPIFGDEGTAGGGFVLFNVASGLRTISVATKSSGQLFTQIMMIAPEVTNALVLP